MSWSTEQGIAAVRALMENPENVEPLPSSASACFDQSPTANSQNSRNSQQAHSALDEETKAFEERAAIMEYEGGLTREEAEFFARLDCSLSRQHHPKD